jgi:hypothetical protein
MIAGHVSLCNARYVTNKQESRHLFSLVTFQHVISFGPSNDSQTFFSSINNKSFTLWLFNPINIC